MGKSMKKKREHLQSMPYEVTPAQRIMREEMEAGVHKSSSALAAVNPPSREHDASIVSGGAPTKLGDLLESELGAQQDAALSARAHEIIEVHGYGLFLSLKQWTIVQEIVEAALVDDALRQ